MAYSFIGTLFMSPFCLAIRRHAAIRSCCVPRRSISRVEVMDGKKPGADNQDGKVHPASRSGSHRGTAVRQMRATSMAVHVWKKPSEPVGSPLQKAHALPSDTVP